MSTPSSSQKCNPKWPLGYYIPAPASSKKRLIFPYSLNARKYDTSSYCSVLTNRRLTAIQLDALVKEFNDFLQKAATSNERMCLLIILLSLDPSFLDYLQSIDIFPKTFALRILILTVTLMITFIFFLKAIMDSLFLIPEFAVKRLKKIVDRQNILLKTHGLQWRLPEGLCWLELWRDYAEMHNGRQGNESSSNRQASKEIDVPFTPESTDLT